MASTAPLHPPPPLSSDTLPTPESTPVLSQSFILTKVSQQVDSGLPENWEVRHSRSKGLPYFFDTTTVSSQWEPPEGTDIDRLKNFIAAYTNAQLTIEPNQPIQKVPTIDAKPQTDDPHAVKPVDSDPTHEIRIAHLLVKWQGSRNPSSWKEAKIERSKDDAVAILTEHERRIHAGETTLRDLAKAESDCVSAHKGGDLGSCQFKRLQRPFAEVAWGLDVGEMSGIVKTDSGYHLIQRLG